MVSLVISKMSKHSKNCINGPAVQDRPNLHAQTLTDRIAGISILLSTYMVYNRMPQRVARAEIEGLTLC